MERVYNPQTGEYLFLVNGQWVPPAQQAVNPKTNERAFLVGDQWQVVSSGAVSKPRPESVEGISPSLAVEQFKSGVAGMQQGYFANTARNNAAILNVLDKIDRGEDVPPAQDVLGYADMDPELRKKTRDAIQSALTSTTAKTIAYGAEKEGYARNPYADRVIKLADDGEYRAAWELFKKDPLGVIQQLSVESTPNMLPSLVTGAVGAVVRGGLGAFMAGMAGGSFPVEFNASIVESLQDAKVDLKDAKAVEAKLRDPEFIKAAGERAVTRGAVIASADAVSGAVLSPFRTGQLAKNVARGAANVAKETGLEMAGEAAAQAATGEDFKVGQILAEGVGALPSAAGVTGIRTAMQTREDVRAQEDALRLEQLRSTLSQTPDEKLSPEQQIAQLSQRYQAQMPKDLADEIATRLVQSRLKGVEAAQEAGVQIPPFIKPDAAEVAELEAAFVAQGISPQAARLEAIQQATESAYQVYLEQEAAKKAEEKAKAEAKDVTAPVPPAGGEGVPVAAQPDVEPPAPGTQVTEPVGVVSPTEDVGIPAGGEAAKPAAVKEEGAPSAAETVETVKTKEEGPTTPVEGATVATTAAPFVGETRPTLAAPVKPLVLADTLANAAFTTRDQVTGAADKFQQLDNSIQQRRQELEDTLIGVSAKPNVQKAALARFDAAVENLKTKEEFDPIGFARAQAQASFDNRNSSDYSSPEEAIDFGRDNVSDTLREQGVKDLRTNGIMDRAFRAYDEEIARLQGTAAPAAPAKRGRLEKVTPENILDTNKYVYHAVRSDDDIAGIVSDGLREGSNISFDAQGQAFAGEGDTILVFRKEDIAPTSKGYQNDGLSTKRAKPVAILKDTSLEADRLTTSELENQAVSAYEEYERLLDYMVREYKLDEATKKEVESFATLGSKYAKRPTLPKEAETDLNRLRELQRRGDNLLRDSESSSEQKISKADVLQRYAPYKLPTYDTVIDFDESADKTVVSISSPVAEPKKAGRPKLTEEQREAAAKKKREQKTAFERNKRAYNRAVELLADPDTRTEALHILKDLRSTSLRPQAQAAVAAAGVTPAEAKRIDDTHAEWRKQREEDKAVAAEEREEKAKDAEVKKAEREAKKAEREQKQAEALAAREKKQAERAARAEQEAEAKKQRQAKAAERKPAAPAVNKQKLAADQKVRSKQDALKKAKGDINKQIAQLELDEALVEQKLVDGAKLEDLGLSADWRDAVNKQISELKAKRYVAETNRILASNNPALLERLLFDLRIRLAKIKQDIAEGTHTEAGINWGNRWRADSPKLTVAEAQAEIDAIAARVQALPPVTGKGKAKAKKGLSQLDALDAEAKKVEKDAEDVIDGEKTAEDVEDEEKDEGLTGKLQFQATRANVDVPDSDYKQDTTGAQAARRLARVASNGFQRLMALRLSRLRVLQDVKFVVLEADDPLPAELAKDLGWAQARGAYDAGTNTIYVKGESQGYLQGVNNTTILHELLHAALHRKIKAGSQAAFKRLMTGEVREVEVLFNDLKRLGKRAEEHLKSLPDMSEDLAALVYGTGVNKDGRFEIFANIDEFLAYGMSDPLFQEFLKTVPVDARTNGFSGFVRAILRYLKLAPNDQSALAQLIDITDQFIKITAVPETKVSGVLKQTALKEKAKDKKAKVDKALAKAQAANTNSPTFLSAIGDLIKLRDGSSELVADILTSRYDQIRGTALRQLLPTLQTETLVEWARRLGLNGVVRSWESVKSENAMRYALINRSLPVAERLTTLQRKDPQMFEALGTVMHFATLRGIDPATEAGRKQSPALEELWERLTPEAKQMYIDVRDHYRAYNDLYHDSLIKRIEDFDIDADSKKNLLASIRKIYETSNKINPYFPLMRYGNFWVRIGKGPSGKFYMFENQAEKELFVRQWVREQQEKDPNTSRQQLYSDGAIEDGNSLRDEGAQSTISSYNDVLQNVFAIIDKAIKKPQSVTDDFGREVKTGSLVKDDRLKDDIYQLILHTLPDRSFRRHFIHRKGKEGFSKDVARNFASLTMDMANQLSRIRYSSAIEGALNEAAASVKGNPDQAKLSEFVGEMRIRAQQITDPNFDDSLSNKLANFTNTTAFLWLMTTVKTAVAQAAAIPVFAVPVLSKYGVFAAHAALARFTPIWNSFGIKERHPDGNESWVAPTVAQSNQVRMNAEERRAAQYMVDRGISDITMAFDLGNRRELPTHVQNSAPRRIQRTVTNVMTGLFHNVERLNREITFMTAFRLARKKYPGESFEQIAARAEQDTYDAMGNFASINRPRGIGANAERQVLLNAHQPLGRSLLQFKMFSAFVTTYIVRNFWRVIGTGYSKEDRKVAAIQLFGTLGYSLTLAGIMGVPGVTFALGILSGLRNLGLGDEEDDILKRDLEFWIRNVWIPDTFGDMKVGGMSVANLLDRGAIAELTGKDITSSLSFNNMWFPEQKEQPTVAAAAQDFFLHMMGPFFSLSAQQIPKAIDKLNQGKVLEGMEQMMPGFVRPTLTAYRYSEQGATTPTGAVIKGAEEFTTGELIAQAMGFSTEGLVGMRETLFKAEALKAQVQNERKKLLDRLALETTRGGENVNAVLEKIVIFNRKNETMQIDGDTINRSLQNRIKRMYATERGLPIEPKYYPLMRDLFNVPIEKLEREAARARQ